MRQSSESKKNNSVIDEKYIRKQCDDLLRQAEIKTPPVNLKILASFAGIVSVEEASIQEAGMLCPTERGLVVLLRDTDNERRKNFTCGHEISHTFFPGYKEKPQKRVDDEVGRYDTYDETESLCDYGASYLLMPDFLFIPQFKQHGFSTNSLKLLSETFESSLEATAIRMVSQNPKRYAVVVWEERYKPVEKKLEVQQSLPGFEDARPQKKLRVNFGYGFDKSEHIPKHKSLDENGTLIARSYETGKAQNGEGLITFSRELAMTCKIHTFPLKKQGRLITLLEKI